MLILFLIIFSAPAAAALQCYDGNGTTKMCDGSCFNYTAFKNDVEISTSKRDCWPQKKETKCITVEGMGVTSVKCFCNENGCNRSASICNLQWWWWWCVVLCLIANVKNKEIIRFYILFQRPMT